MKLGWLQTRGSSAASSEAYQDVAAERGLNSSAQQLNFSNEPHDVSANTPRDGEAKSPDGISGADRDYLEARVQLGVREAVAYTEQRFAAEMQKLRGGDRDEAEKRVQLGVAQAVAYADSRIGGIASDVQDLRQHIPGFLNAVATVPALAHQISSIVAERDALSGKLRELEQRCSQIDAMIIALKTPEPEPDPTIAADLAPIHTQLADGWLEPGGPLDSRVQALINQSYVASADRANLWKAAEGATRTIGELWNRVEFVRREIMYELRYGPAQASASHASREPRIIDEAKVEDARRSDNLRLNVGCGHLTLPGYINIDFRDLPGIDVVAEIGNLPFEPGSIHEIASSHVLEHFPQEQLRRLLPYWRRLLQSGGTFRAVVPDGEAMLRNLASNTYPFEQFRMVLFGAQEYEGDFHFNLLTPDSLIKELTDAGYIDIDIPVRGRKNDISFDFEITATAP